MNKCMIKKENQTMRVVFELMLFVLSPVLMMPYSFYRVAVEKEKSKQYFYLFLCSTAMGFLAFHTVPLQSDDLYRHYTTMESLKKIALLDFYKIRYEIAYLNMFIMAIFAKLGIPQLYPTLFVTIGYGLVIYIYIKVTEKKDLTKSEKLSMLLFFLFVANCRDFISGLRNYFSFIICMFLIVGEKVYHRKKVYTYIGILCVTFIHSSAFAFLVWEIVSEFSERKYWKRGILGAIFLILPTLFLLSKGIIPFIPDILVEKLDMYISSASIDNFNVFILQMGILILMIGCHLLNRKKKNIQYQKINDFLDYYLVFMISIIPVMLFFSRFVYFLVIISPVILVQTYVNLKENIFLRRCLLCVLSCFIAAGVLMLLASVRAYPWNFDVKNILIWWL